MEGYTLTLPPGPASTVTAPAYRYILGTRVHATSYQEATQLILSWARTGESSYICATSAHGVVESSEDPTFQRILNEAALITPDGMPLVWGLKRLGLPDAMRVYGPTLTLHVCEAAAEGGVPIGLYGGTPESLDDFSAFLRREFPAIEIACQIAPPFRPLTPEEDEAYTREICDSGARLLFVGIGCPKQERWMAEHRGRIPAVMLGVGAAFDFHAGRVTQAPRWMQQAGMEWAFRLLMEPRRLWKRYRRIVPLFALRFGRQLYLDRSPISSPSKPIPFPKKAA